MKMKLRLFVLAGLLLSTMPVFAQDTNFLVFLSFGQSNMEGFPGIEPQDKTAVDNRFQVLASVDFPGMDRKKGHWYPAVPPLCRPSTGLCPADYFGRTMVSSLPANIAPDARHIFTPLLRQVRKVLAFLRSYLHDELYL